MPRSAHRRRMANIAFLAAATRKLVPNVIALVACTTKPKYLQLSTLSTISGARISIVYLHVFLLNCGRNGVAEVVSCLQAITDLGDTYRLGRTSSVAGLYRSRGVVASPSLIWEHLVSVMIFEAEKPIKFELW